MRVSAFIEVMCSFQSALPERSVNHDYIFRCPTKSQSILNQNRWERDLGDQ